MGILSDVLDFEKVNFKDIYDKLREDPERAFIGAVDPFSSWMWGQITGKDYEPLVNQLGGPYGGGGLGTGNTGGVYEKAEAQGVNTYPSAVSHDIAEVIAMMYGGQGAASGLGSAFGGGSSAASSAGSGSGVLSAGDAAAMDAAGASAAMNGTSGMSAASGMGMSAPSSGFNWSQLGQQGMGLLGQAQANPQQQPTAVSAPPQQQPNNSLQQRVAMQRRIQQLRQKPRKSLAEQQELQELMRNSQGLL